MKIHYTDEKHIQVLIVLLKAHGISKIIASPGTTNITFVRSLQNDPFFRIFSAVDERSAAYMACGLSSETGEPVVLSCTGATASRNYLSGLTEAYYRKLPILAVTSTQETSKIGHHVAQVIDRSVMPKDSVMYSVELSLIKDENDFWDTEIKANIALLELKRNGGGPVHINMVTSYNRSFQTFELPKIRTIERITQNDSFPKLPDGKIAILIGSHSKMTSDLEKIVDQFCESNNAVVFCDHTSGYKGAYRVLHSLSSSQRLSDYDGMRPNLLIHLGEITGDYSVNKIIGDHVWRVSSDGEVRDTFGKLRVIFDMPEVVFLKYYSLKKPIKECERYIDLCTSYLKDLNKNIPELPFSNIWIASKVHNTIPANSTIHFAILNSLRAWNFFELPESVDSSSNVGGFGIDGCLSSLIGASFANENKIFFGIIGDLSFFYDMNSIGNKNVKNNLRILLINNGTGIEFKNFSHFGAQFGESADDFIAARGHFGNKSKTLIKNYSQCLGFDYFTASNKDEFLKSYELFFSQMQSDRPIIFEVFTNPDEESKALEIITSINRTTIGKTKDAIRNVLGTSKTEMIKKILKK